VINLGVIGQSGMTAANLNDLLCWDSAGLWGDDFIVAADDREECRRGVE
jgi:hypothetical protein